MGWDEDGMDGDGDGGVNGDRDVMDTMAWAGAHAPSPTSSRACWMGSPSSGGSMRRSSRIRPRTQGRGMDCASWKGSMTPSSTFTSSRNPARKPLLGGHGAAPHPPPPTTAWPPFTRRCRHSLAGDAFGEGIEGDELDGGGERGTHLPQHPLEGEEGAAGEEGSFLLHLRHPALRGSRGGGHGHPPNPDRHPPRPPAAGGFPQPPDG